MLLLGGTSAGTLPLWKLAGPPLRALAVGPSAGLPHPMPLDRLVVVGCAAALAACWLWLLACVWLVVLRALHRNAREAGPPRPVRGCPRLVQVLVLLALGVAATGPAHAAPGRPAEPAPSGSRGHVPGLGGLALPDRVAAAPSRSAVVAVRPGDSLWSVARRVLPSGASDAAVDRMWRRIAATNADRLGPDPDLIFPGTLLRVPQPGRALGKDDL